MTVSSGFFNGADRPSNASEICSIFDGVITDGIFSTIGDLFAVLAVGGNNISIGSGKAWFHHSWLKNDATIIKEAEAAEVLLNRIDIVVLEFDSSDPVRDNNIKIIKGTPATNPVPPELSNGPLKFQHKIAEISRSAGSTEILQINITPFQGTSGTPLVTGLVQQADITVILQQFANEMIDLQDQYEDALLTMQQNGIPAHHNNHSAGSSDPIAPDDIGAAKSAINSFSSTSLVGHALDARQGAAIIQRVNELDGLLVKRFRTFWENAAPTVGLEPQFIPLEFGAYKYGGSVQFEYYSSTSLGSGLITSPLYPFPPSDYVSLNEVSNYNPTTRVVTINNPLTTDEIRVALAVGIEINGVLRSVSAASGSNVTLSSVPPVLPVVGQRACIYSSILCGLYLGTSRNTRRLFEVTNFGIILGKGELYGTYNSTALTESSSTILVSKIKATMRWDEF